MGTTGGEKINLNSRKLAKKEQKLDQKAAREAHKTSWLASVQRTVDDLQDQHAVQKRNNKNAPANAYKIGNHEFDDKTWDSQKTFGCLLILILLYTIFNFVVLPFWSYLSSPVPVTAENADQMHGHIMDG
eukprot:gnl/TRDRNA2_/TRDRNA2_162959_c0_seq1.p1 gnl/TRDRNA2_/TRDRNA2_162959_c0~~gnl/TRDRNA2_/TRDRNA2_162959_c0_seq1.p1  ORF type:complete len:130 (+),score=28.48 gnl/TRDRNA2_/TRDRNA2_162959_c0_seq1:95-484(+)